MHYTAFSIQHLKKGTSRKAVAAVVHAFSGCGRCEDKGCACCEGGLCQPDCQCHKGKSCSTCNFKTGGKTFKWILAEMKGGIVFAVITRSEMMQLDVYTVEQFGFKELRMLNDKLREFSENGHLTMTHMQRDRLTEETG